MTLDKQTLLEAAKICEDYPKEFADDPVNRGQQMCADALRLRAIAAQRPESDRDTVLDFFAWWDFCGRTLYQQGAKSPDIAAQLGWEAAIRALNNAGGQEIPAQASAFVRGPSSKTPVPPAPDAAELPQGEPPRVSEGHIGSPRVPSMPPAAAAPSAASPNGSAEKDDLLRFFVAWHSPGALPLEMGRDRLHANRDRAIELLSERKQP